MTFVKEILSVKLSVKLSDNSEVGGTADIVVVDCWAASPPAQASQ